MLNPTGFPATEIENRNQNRKYSVSTIINIDI